jgi:preprotein translocase SecE subunit
MKFFTHVYTEMTKVVWPSRAKTLTFSVIVILVSVFVAYYLGLFDYLFQNYGLRSLL